MLTNRGALSASATTPADSQDLPSASVLPTTPAQEEAQRRGGRLEDSKGKPFFFLSNPPPLPSRSRSGWGGGNGVGAELILFGLDLPLSVLPY